MTAIQSARLLPAVVLIGCFLEGCGKSRPSPAPSIEFTKIPPFAEGSALKFYEIAGRAKGAGPGQRVILYARSGLWWVQPMADKAITPLDSQSEWSNHTHPGSAYAALLVAPGFHPSSKMDFLPPVGPFVLAVAEVQGTVPPEPSRRVVMFDGYEWRVRSSPNDPGGTRNEYDVSNAWTDPAGSLHLRIAGSPAHWTSAGINLSRSLGYGTYRFVVRDVSHLEPSAVFTMRTWDDSGPTHEMDIEMSRWGDPAARNGQFAIQPYYIPANTFQFNSPAQRVTFMLRWEPEKASFKVFPGAVSNWDSSAAVEHMFTSAVPPAGEERINLDLYVFGNNPTPLQHPNEVIVEKFEFLP
jgi:hypothetical protein